MSVSFLLSYTLLYVINGHFYNFLKHKRTNLYAMSSRALRKAQKERERRQLETAHEEEGSEDDDAVEEEEEEEPSVAPKSSMFAMLDMDEGGDEEQEEDAELEDTIQKQTDGVANLGVGRYDSLQQQRHQRTKV